MEKLVLDLPTMYGDHHVIQVRHVLAGLPGVKPVYISATWQQAEIEYDPEQIAPQAIREALASHGYSHEAPALPLVASRNALTTAFAHGPGEHERFMERLPAWDGPPMPCPGFEIRRLGEIHPADRAEG